MKSFMITRDAETFVALARAVMLAHAEGALDDATSVDLSAALVAGMITGCMEMSTYGKVHDALAVLLEKAFEGPAYIGNVAPGGDSVSSAEPLGVYLEVVGNAWDKVTADDEPCGVLTEFVRRSFDLQRARFGETAWFRAPLKIDFHDLLRRAKSAGLLLISIQGASPEVADAVLNDPSSQPGRARAILGWGDRRTALDILPAEKT
jgi:hypothetical protein